MQHKVYKGREYENEENSANKYGACKLIRRDAEKKKTNIFVLFANGSQEGKIKHKS